MEKIRAVAMSVTERVAQAWLSISSRAPTAPENGEDTRQRGQGLAEYSLILSGIAVVAIASLIFLGGSITELFWDPISAEFGRVLCELIGICPT